MPIKLRFFPILILYFGYIIALPAYSITPEEIVAKVEKRYSGLKSLSANFEQSVQTSSGRIEKRKGKIYLKKPGKYRLETKAQTVVSDGKSVWTYVPANNQVVVMPKDSEDSSNPENFLFQYSQNFTSSLVESKKGSSGEIFLIRSVPKRKDSSIRQLDVLVDSKTWLTSKAEYIDFNGSKITYLLSKVKTDPKLSLSDELFRFHPPKGTEIIDMRR